MSAPDYNLIVYELCNEVASVRERLQVIVDGQIERGHASPGSPMGPLECGKRKLLLTDAKQICSYAIARLNQAINRAHDSACPNSFLQKTTVAFMKNTKLKYETREQWLEAAVRLMVPLFEKGSYKVPRVRVSCGWPSSRGVSSKNAALGECWDTSAAEDKLSQIFISPRLSKPLDEQGVLAVLGHEVCHGVVGNKAKHGKKFKAVATLIGLEGKMTSTVGGKEFLERAAGWVKELGEYPHASLKPGMRPTKKQTTRMVKCECEACGYSVRTSRKWLEESGAVLCPCNKKPMSFKIPDELEGDDE